MQSAVGIHCCEILVIQTHVRSVRGVQAWIWVTKAVQHFTDSDFQCCVNCCWGKPAHAGHSSPTAELRSMKLTPCLDSLA